MRLARSWALGAFMVLTLLAMHYLSTKNSAAPAPDAQANPFFTASALPFMAHPFDKIKESDYTPAMEDGMKRKLV